MMRAVTVNNGACKGRNPANAEEQYERNVPSPLLSKGPVTSLKDIMNFSSWLRAWAYQNETLLIIHGINEPSAKSVRRFGTLP